MPSPPSPLTDFPYASHTLDLNGVGYRYVDEGSGPPILCVHGNPTWSYAFRHVVSEFKTTHRVIAVDHVGCGRSDKPQEYRYVLDQHVENLCRLIDTLDLREITLVAHDWGGAIGMGAAVRRPDRFARFMLSNTAAFPAPRIPLRIAVCRTPLLGALGVRGLNLFARAALLMAVEHPDRMTPEVKAAYLAPYDNWHNRVAILRFVEDIPMRSSHVSYRTLAEIDAGLEQFRSHPVQFVWGEKDWCFTTEFLDDFLKRFPEAKTVRIPDAGHYIFEDAREQYIASLRDFVGVSGKDKT